MELLEYILEYLMFLSMFFLTLYTVYLIISTAKAFLNKPVPVIVEFAKGDQVTAFGNTGTVHSIGINGYLSVRFPECDSLIVFRTDGKQQGWHKHVSLTKV